MVRTLYFCTIENIYLNFYQAVIIGISGAYFLKGGREGGANFQKGEIDLARGFKFRSVDKETFSPLQGHVLLSVRTPDQAAIRTLKPNER